MTMTKTTLAEQAYQELRERIISGRLPGGRRLLPNDLAADLGISPTPVKEACLRLEADGLVSTSSRRGMVVRSFSEEDVAEIYAARILIEKGAVEAAFDAGRLDETVCRSLSRSLEQHRRFAAGTSLETMADKRGNPQRYSVMVDFSNSEFSRFRLQYSLDQSRPNQAVDNQIFLQYIFSLGSHPAHQF